MACTSVVVGASAAFGGSEANEPAGTGLAAAAARAALGVADAVGAAGLGIPAVHVDAAMRQSIKPIGAGCPWLEFT
jgi:hypothetical protein